MIEKFIPYIVSFLLALAFTLVLTPIVRVLNRRFGIVDRPGERRLNKRVIPRGGGIAVYVGVVASYTLFVLASDLPPLGAVPAATFWKLIACAGFIMVVGFFDDKWSLPPLVKLLCQLVVSFLIWYWVGLGFSDIWPFLPPVVDCIITMLWLTGAMNAFNLIDGLDGLASGLAVIAVTGMAGGLFFTGQTGQITFYAAFIGGLIGFLKYNYNPASIFLGDSGSMMIGCLVASLPLCSHVQNSFLVSVGVPLLAMGVPLFDTSLAIIRRSIRRFLHAEGDGSLSSGRVMTADTDHIHHRILRSVGLNQSRAALILYGVALFAVIVGLVAAYMRSRTVGLWLAAFSVAVVVIFRDMARVEFFDMGRLLNHVARTQGAASRHIFVRLAIPISIICDVLLSSLSVFVVAWLLDIPVNDIIVRIVAPTLVAAVFVALVASRSYITVWSRAMALNYVKLFLVCVLSSIAGSVVIYYFSESCEDFIFRFGFVFAFVAFSSLLLLRVFRVVFRDFFYDLDCSRLVGRKDVSRILVYGAGLRYRAFRRELVRHTSENSRIVMGLIDDDAMLKGRYVGAVRVLGALDDVPHLINEYNIDAVVIACALSAEKLETIKERLSAYSIALHIFTFSEEILIPASDGRKENSL